jgi:hypothetical protein
METHDKHLQQQGHEMQKGMYRHLAIETVIHGVIMFLVMYVMIDTLNDFYLNINQVYMTLMMVAPMVIIMLVGMRSMYKNKRLNYALIVASVVVFVGSFFLIRSQFPVGDTQFVRSMIPHHSGAILMCREAQLSDPELITLCEEIIAAQREEITQMETILSRLE